MFISPFEFTSNYSKPSDRGYTVTPFNYTRSIAMITYPGVKKGMYTVNTEGGVSNIHTGQMMTPFVAGGGYLAVGLQQEFGYTKNFHVHRLVAYQFCNPPCDGDISNYTVNHIDGNIFNNTCGNLEWISYAANNHHAMEVLYHTSHPVVNGRPIVNEEFVRYVCEQFVAGKSNTEIMRELGMTIDNANHTLLRDIRGGYTWTNITCQYNFDRSSKKHAYTKEEKAQIDNMILKGMTDYEVFKVMQGRAYNPSTDRLDSSYRSIQTRRVALRKKGFNV